MSVYKRRVPTLIRSTYKSIGCTCNYAVLNRIMSTFKIVIVLGAILALALSSPAQEGRDPRGALNTILRDVRSILPFDSNWIACDVTTDPLLSCQDCQTRKLCNVLGGLLLPCRNPLRPYCINGVCSPVPSESCQTTEEPDTEVTSTNANEE